MGSAKTDEVTGCTNPTACNYDANLHHQTPTTRSCVIPSRRVRQLALGRTDGTGTVVDNDADDDGVCDARTRSAGCTDS